MGLHLKKTLSTVYTLRIGDFMQKLVFFFNILNGELQIYVLITELF